MKPVIDVHTHIFSAQDIPLKGYLLSRNYKGLLKVVGPLLIPLIARCLRGRLDPLSVNNFWFRSKCFIPLKIAYAAMGSPYKEWAEVMANPVNAINRMMLETYAEDNIDLFVPLMIDYEYWFKNTPDTDLKTQIEFIYEGIIKPNRGRIHPFVPFDPARELAFEKGMKNPDGTPETFGSFNLVKDAIENKGFIGVKLYNAMGYKPFNNKTVEANRRKIALHKRKYVFSGEDYDRVLCRLYDYCAENDVPITTHCNMYGSESYPDASFDFGKAIFWRDVLNQTKYKKLRLNLAHFGWNPKQGYHGNNTWVKDICTMFLEYENLYADVSHHRIIGDKEQEQFKSDYQDLVRGFPIVKNRLLFGTDWHVNIRMNGYETFKENYIEILKYKNLFSISEIEDFLGGNSLRFLGIKKGSKSYLRLKDFYEQNKIEYPNWIL